MFERWKTHRKGKSQPVNAASAESEGIESGAVAELQKQQDLRMKALVDDLIDRQNKVLEQLHQRASVLQNNVSINAAGGGDTTADTIPFNPQDLISQRLQSVEKNLRTSRYTSQDNKSSIEEDIHE